MRIPTIFHRATLAAALLLGASSLGAPVAWSQEVGSIPPAPPRAEGEGPWKRLILRGATLVVNLPGSPGGCHEPNNLRAYR